MKMLFCILMCVMTLNLTAQDSVRTGNNDVRKDSTYYVFTRSEVLSITNNIRRLQAKISAYDTLTTAYKTQLMTLNEIIRTDEDMFRRYDEQIKLYQSNEQLYKQTIEDMKPKWYENPWLYLVGGVVLGYVIVK